MRSLLLGCLWLLSACSPAQLQQERLSDGSIKFTCDLPMDECVRRAQEACSNQRFRILEGISETRVRDVPPFENAYHTSRLHLVCTNDGAKPLLSLDSPSPEPAAAPAKPASACSLGETRECVGPGACKGGQACLSDRTGFGPCDCGPSPAPPAGSAAAPDAVPAAAPAGATSPPTARPPEQPIPASR